MLHPAPPRGRRAAPTRPALERLEERCLLSAGPPPSDMVLRWNEVLLDAVRRHQTTPPEAARNMAIVHLAIYDAVNSIERSAAPYLVQVRVPRSTSEPAAVAAAACEALSHLYPDQAQAFLAARQSSLALVPDGPAEDRGVALGRLVADALLAARADDGSAAAVSYTPGSGPGVWQPTPPGYLPALLPQWPGVTPFAMPHGDAFRPPPPPALGSAAYAEAFNEVKAYGAADSSVRTPEETQIALFWADGAGTVTPPGHWNEIAQDVARARGTTLAENARLFALLNAALADAAVVAWDAKYAYNFWRPVTAIRQGDPGWSPLLVTPPFPSYTSGHSTFSAAAAAVLAGFFGTDKVAFTTTSDALPGVTRSFAGFWEAAGEAGQSRVYGGIHFQFDNQAGLSSGLALGRFVVANLLLPTGNHAAAQAGALPAGSSLLVGPGSPAGVRAGQDDLAPQVFWARPGQPRHPQDDLLLWGAS